MVDHDVVWLDVTVHDPHAVTVVQSLQQLMKIKPNVHIAKLLIQILCWGEEGEGEGEEGGRGRGGKEGGGGGERGRKGGGRRGRGRKEGGRGGGEGGGGRRG